MDDVYFNKDDVVKYYDLLNHTIETEVRLYNNKANLPARKFFVHGRDEFVSLIEENKNKNLNISAGLNEREAQKSGDDDVRKFGCVLVDFDAHDDGATLEDIEKHAQDLLIKFSGSNIQASLAFSGRGYHILVPFKAVELTKDNRTEWAQKLKVLKQYFVDKFGVDGNTFNLSRMSRVIGTYNIEAKKISRWIDYRGYQDNFEFIDLMNELYKNAEIINKISVNAENGVIDDAVEAQRKCKFFDDIATRIKFPEGERYNTLIKNLAMYTNFTGKMELREKFTACQNTGLNEFTGWDAAFKDGSFKKFNCGEISNYCKKYGIENPCHMCQYNNFRYNEKKYSFSISKADKATFIVKKLLYQGGKTNIGKHGVLTKKLLYNVFEIGFLTGNRSTFCVTTNQADLREGDEIKFIVPLNNNSYLKEVFTSNPPENNILLKMAKEFDIDQKEAKKRMEEGVLFDTMLAENEKTLDPYFVCLGSGVDENDIKSLGNEDAKKVVDDYITLGLSVDSRVKLAMDIDFFIPDITTTDFKTYQFYNPHKILFTGTKAGKTTISQRLGHNAARTTVKNLLGFATADDIIRGTLHGSVLPYYIDELEEEESKSTFGKLLNYFESGIVNIDVGKKSIRCEGLASITFLGNPKENNENGQSATEIEIVNQFNSTLNTITNNYSAFGSRMGLIIFDSNTKQLSGTQKFNQDEYDILSAKFEYLRYNAAPKFNKILGEPLVVSFLTTPFDKTYQETIKMLSQKVVIKSIKEFMNGSLNSYRHTNGAAIRLACLDYLADIVNDDYDIEKIVTKAKEYLEVCKSINLDSLKKFVNNKVVEEFYAKGYKSYFEQETMDMKTLLSSLYNYIRENGKKETIYATDIHPYILDNRFRGESRSARTIVERVDKQILNHKYGIEYNNIENIEYFVIRDSAPLTFMFGDFSDKNIYATAKGAN